MSSKLPSIQSPSSIIEQLQGFNEDELNHDPKVRKAAFSLARKLAGTLEDPMNTAILMLYSPFLATAAKIGTDLNIYELIDKHSETSITTKELSKQSGGDPLLLSRILRMLASVSFVAQVDKDEWTSTPVTKAMATPPMMAGNRFTWDLLVTSSVKSPDYLRENNYICPTDPTKGFLQYAHQTRYNTFDYLAKSRPERLSDFNIFMGHAAGARKTWVEWYPVREKLLATWRPDTPLLVDVGGGKGHDLQAFRDKYPETASALILQDLPQALDNIKPGTVDDAITRQVQDFFEPNQVRGAKAYFLHHILHDWSEDFALRILAHLRDAMTPGYSRLLIHEFVMPDTDVPTFPTLFDWIMMTFNGGMERSRSQWTELLERAGFKVVGFSFGNEGDDANGVVEAMVEEKEAGDRNGESSV